MRPKKGVFVRARVKAGEKKVFSKKRLLYKRFVVWYNGEWCVCYILFHPKLGRFQKSKKRRFQKNPIWDFFIFGQMKLRCFQESVTNRLFGRVMWVLACIRGRTRKA